MSGKSGNPYVCPQCHSATSPNVEGYDHQEAQQPMGIVMRMRCKPCNVFWSATYVCTSVEVPAAA